MRFLFIAVFAVFQIASAHADWQDRGPRPGHRRSDRQHHRPQGDMRGHCADYDHSQFVAAKNFAYSGSGLNYGSSDAQNWAIQYNASHACGTIAEYSARYQALYQYAYSGNYMNMGSNDAREYALSLVEKMPVNYTEQWKVAFQAVYQLLYSGNYMNNGSSVSIAAARAWNERGYCGDSQDVERIKSVYLKEYQFAYSGSGLNYGSSQAKSYAIERISQFNLTRCADLFQ